AKFFEAPSRESLRDLLRNHIGELNDYDFKGQWPAYPKTARHILGFANSGGGCLIVGVEERDDKTFDPVGIDQLRDKADVQKGIQKCIPAQLKYEVLDFTYEASEYPKIVGKKFQVVLIEDHPQYIPFVSMSDGDGIRASAVYVRRGTSTEEVNYEELQKMINRRIEKGYSSQGEFDLEKHLAELSVIYSRIPRFHNPFQDTLEILRGWSKNPQFPEGDYEAFVKGLIDEKKKIIERITLRRQ
ncbi:MAG TPA: RNA-binding domain-containing protein, partial [Nitrospiria bacterium]|nr:RNA-binding domain-containing protein [Nitrospiria bacterium]